ncbi:hypothetical protein ACJ41O_013149 [Fusarium nematophilum]
MSATWHPGDNVPLVIDGARVTGVSKLPVNNPGNGSEIWTYSGASVQDSIRAVEAADAAFPAWSSTHPRARSEILFKAAELFLARRAELIECMKLETAAEDAFAEFNIEATVGQLKDIARRIFAIEGYSPHMDDGNRSALVTKIPYGVILGIAPWNAPYILGTRAVAAALAAGNTAVLKGSELSPGCFYAIMNIFSDAGLPKGCLNLIFAPPEAAREVTEAVIQHPAVAKVNFTGSTAVGRIIASISGKHLKPVLLELGGKATAIVFEDADLQRAAKACLLGAFLHVRPTGEDDVLAPTILSNVRGDMDLFYTESFGLVATLHTFNTEDEALKIANDTEYGLAGAVFTQNLNRGLRVAKKYLAGAVHINSMSIHDEAVLPHGGMKNSGSGRFNADQGLNEFLRSQVITWEN